MPTEAIPRLKRFRRFRRAALDFFLPTFCLECGAPARDSRQTFFCTTCWNVWPGIDAPACRGCGRPLEERIGYAPEPAFFCADCTRGHRDVRYVWAAARYQGIAATAIRAFKFRRWEGVADLLGPLLLETVQRSIGLAEYEAFVPVPLHWRRKWWRGFNQAQLLAGHVGAVAGAPPVRSMLKRTRYTTPQSRLMGRERERNLTGAFAIRSGKALTAIQGKRFLLVDDVSTTGATLRECARTLLAAGAADVDALVLAITGTVRK